MVAPQSVGRLITCGALVAGGVVFSCGGALGVGVIALGGAVGSSLFEAANDLAVNVLAGDIVNVLDRGRLDAQANHDLRHAVGVAISAALLRAAPRTGGCLNSDRRRLARLARVARSDAWAESPNVGAFSELNDNAITQMFAAGTRELSPGAAPERAHVFETDTEWNQVFAELRRLSNGCALPSSQFLKVAAEDLHAHFPIYLRNVVKGDPRNPPTTRAFACLQLNLAQLAFSSLQTILSDLRNTHQLTSEIRQDVSHIRCLLDNRSRALFDAAKVPSGVPGVTHLNAAWDKLREASDQLAAFHTTLGRVDAKTNRIHKATRRILRENLEVRRETRKVRLALGELGRKNATDRQAEIDALRTRHLAPDEFDQLRSFAVRYMGGSIAPVEKLKSWVAVNPNVFTALERPTNKRGLSYKLVGYYSVRPTTAEAAQLFDTCELDGASMLPEHIAPPGTRPHAVYVGGVAAKRGVARGALLKMLEIAVTTYVESHGVRDIYAKPLTEDGERLLRSKGFERLCKEDGSSRDVYRLRLPS